MSVLVVDVGTSGVRAAVVRPDGTIEGIRRREVLPTTPMQGFVELDPTQLADAVLDVAHSALAAAGAGGVQGVGIANQRATTIVWERSTGRPAGPGIGWQDLRTVVTCLSLQGRGIRLAPNMSATKLVALLDMVDPARTGDFCFGTVDTWVAWTLSQGSCHVTDATNAGVTGLVKTDGSGWDAGMLDVLNIPASVLPQIVDSSGTVGEATALPGSPPICGIAGDQQASLVGQGCTRPGLAKATFGTGGMLDQCVGERPGYDIRGPHGTFPIVAWRRGGTMVWGTEAVMLAAGTNVEWMRDDLRIIATAEESDTVAASCPSAGGVVYVPALLGLGTPVWDFGARGTFLGITRGTTRAEMVRAVLEGVAQRGADLVEAAELDTGLAIAGLRVDGGMSANVTFVQALADATARPIELSPVAEATTLGAAYLAGIAQGIWRDEEEVAAAWTPRDVVEPRAGAREAALARAHWLEARSKAEQTIPELSGLSF